MAPGDRQDRFYNDLEPFSTFAGILDLGAYRPVPADWVVLITDVRGSTSAIAEGRYKNVNMVGAASITAVLNVSGDIEVPYVFGGDGASLVVPGSLAEPALDALLRLKAASRAMFGLELRVGAIPLADIRQFGDDIGVRKYQLSPRNFLAMFCGRGLELADILLKNPAPDNRYLAEAPPDGGEADLTGLSCRWEPLQPQNGRMMTLMVRATGADPGTESTELAGVLERLSAILGHGLEDAAPASKSSMRLRWPPHGLALEARATAGRGGFLVRYLGICLQSLIQYGCDTFGRKAGDYDPPTYHAELRANTDFRKFDGMLRTVLDVSQAQADAIEAYLEDEYRAGRLVYGTHVADRALMTCLVFSLAAGEHVHFIDGADGGFAMAATAYKQRVRAGSRAG